MARLRLVLPLLGLALLAGCGSARPAGLLPPQGLVVQGRHAVLLVGLDGRVLRTLPGFTMAAGSRDLALDAMTQAESAVPVLLGPRGRVWEILAGELVPIAPLTVPLPGAAEIVGRVLTRRSDGSPVMAVSVRDTATGRPLATGPPWRWFVTPAGLLVTSKAVTDLVTRERWRLRGADWAQATGTSFCNPAGLRDDRVVAVCWFEGNVRVFSVAHDGRRELLGRPFRYGQFGAQTAFLSPDGRHVAASLAVGCGLSPSIIAPTTGGAPRYIDGSPAAHPGRHVQSRVLGWTLAGKVVAEFQHGECEKASPPAVYLVDPDSFRRTRIYVLPPGTAGFALWSPTP